MKPSMMRKSTTAIAAPYPMRKPVLGERLLEHVEREDPGRSERTAVGHDRNEVEGAQRPDDRHHEGDEGRRAELGEDHVPQHPPPPRAVQPPRLHLFGVDRVEPGQVEDHAVGGLRPEARDDDPVRDERGVPENVERPGAEPPDDRVEQSERRVVEPGEDEAHDHLADDEGEEEEGLVEPDAGDGLVQEDGDEESGRDREQIEDQPLEVVPQGGLERPIDEQPLVVPEADVAGFAQAVPLVQGELEALEDREDDVDEKEQHAGGEKHPRRDRPAIAMEPALLRRALPGPEGDGVSHRGTPSLPGRPPSRPRGAARVRGTGAGATVAPRPRVPGPASRCPGARIRGAPGCRPDCRGRP